MEKRTDAELLDNYVSRGDDTAFAEIIARHGAFVHRTCLRLLKDEHEAEDACLAVFIVLARKARGLRRGDLSAWLYRVSHLVAAETVRKRMRRTQREERYAADDVARRETVTDEVARQAVLDAVDAELVALSARHREAVVLRYLRSHRQKEAAQLAGCSVGTLSSRKKESPVDRRGDSADPCLPKDLRRQIVSDWSRRDPDAARQWGQTSAMDKIEKVELLRLTEFGTRNR